MKRRSFIATAGAVAAVNRVLSRSIGRHQLTRVSGTWQLRFAPARPLAALEAVAANTVFTTHTVVPAGHDHFPEDAVRTYLAAACPELVPNLDAILALAHSPTAHDFNMTSLALHGSRHQNGVSKIHGRISSRLCADCWPQIEPQENPLRSITNGVHVPTFLHTAWSEVFDRHLGPDWRKRLADAAYWRRVRMSCGSNAAGGAERMRQRVSSVNGCAL